MHHSLRRTACGFLFAAALALTGGLTGCQTGGTGDMQTDTARSGGMAGGMASTRPAERQARAAADSRQQVSAQGTRQFTLAAPIEQAVSLVAQVPAQVRLGQPFDYRLSVTNDSDQPVHQVQVLDVTEEEPEVLWNVGTLAAGATETTTLPITLRDEESVRNCITVTYNPAVCVIIDVVNPELRLTKTGPAETIFCQPFEYVYTLTNTGTGVARNVTVTDQLPEGLTIVEGGRGRNVAGRVDELGPNQSRELRVRVDATEPGTFSSAARAESAGDVTTSQEVTTLVREAELDLTIQAPEAEYVGQTVNYRVNVANNGDAASQPTTLTLTAQNSARQPQSRELPAIQPGQSVEVPVTLVAGDRTGELQLTAVVEPFCQKVDELREVVTTEILAIQALQIETIDRQDPVQVGQETSYVINVLNEGSSPVENVQLTGELPSTFEFVSGDGASNVTGQGQTVTFAPVTIPAGREALWEVNVRAIGAGQESFRLEMTAPGFETPIIEEEPTRAYNPGEAGQELEDNK